MPARDEFVTRTEKPALALNAADTRIQLPSRGVLLGRLSYGRDILAVLSNVHAAKTHNTGGQKSEPRRLTVAGQNTSPAPSPVCSRGRWIRISASSGCVNIATRPRVAVRRDVRPRVK